MRPDRFSDHMPSFAYADAKKGQNFQQLAKTYRVWERQFNAIWSRLEGHNTTPPRPVKSTGMKQLKKLLLFDNIQDMKAHWSAKPRQKRELDWRHTMLTAMNFHPERAAEVLQATLEPGVTPYWAVSDVFCFLARWSAKQPAQIQREQQDALASALLHLLQETPARTFQLQSWVLAQIMAGCSSDALVEIYAALRNYHHRIHFNTQLKIAGRLAGDGKSRLLSLQIFEDIVAAKQLDINDRRLAALATSMLTLPKGWKDGLYSPTEVQAVAEVFERILSLGYSPNYVTYTSMIRALCLTDQLDTAWKIYDVMRDQGATLDSHVYSILLHGARQAGSLDSVHRIVDEMPPKIFESTFFWNELLHAVIATAIKESRDKKLPPPRAIPAFSSMLRIYTKFFQRRPLQTLIPVNLRGHFANRDMEAGALDSWNWSRKVSQLFDKLPALPHNQRKQPEPHTLTVMLSAFVHNFDTLRPVQGVYDRLRKMLKLHHPVAVSLVKNGTHPYDILIKAITENLRQLNPALRIVRDMLLDNPKPVAGAEAEAAATAAAAEAAQTTVPAESDVKTTGADDTQSAKKAAFPHPAPSIYTWNNLMAGFTDRDSMNKALMAIETMRGRGVHPNRVTWNVLARGFARRQREATVRRVLRNLERAGYHPDVHTVRAASHLQHPEPVLALVERRAEFREATRRRRVREAVASWVVSRPGRRLTRDEVRKRSRARYAAIMKRRRAGRRRQAAKRLPGAEAGQASDSPKEKKEPREVKAAVPTPDPDVAAASELKVSEKVKATPAIGAYMELYSELVVEPKQDQVETQRGAKEGNKQTPKE